MRRENFFQLIGLAAAVLTSCGAVAQRPSVGTNATETREIALLKEIPVPCVSIALSSGKITLLLARRDLEDSAASAKQPLNAEQEMTARIEALEARLEALRAAALLARTGSTRDARGCFEHKGPLNASQVYWLIARLERSKAAMFDGRNKALIPKVRVRYVVKPCETVCGKGDMMLYRPGEATPFLVSYEPVRVWAVR